MRNLLAGAALALTLNTQAVAGIQEEAVTYKDGDTVLKGFVVYDALYTWCRSLQGESHNWPTKATAA